jgi:hypothetical protein
MVHGPDVPGFTLQNDHAIPDCFCSDGHLCDLVSSRNEEAPRRPVTVAFVALLIALASGADWGGFRAGVAAACFDAMYFLGLEMESL